MRIATLLVAAVGLLAPAQGLAQDVKELMSRAQTQAEQRAVDELVRKLHGGPQPRPAALPVPTAGPQVAAPQTTTSPAALPQPAVQSPASPTAVPSQPRPEPAARITLPAAAPPVPGAPSSAKPPPHHADPFEPMPEIAPPRRPAEAAPAPAQPAAIPVAQPSVDIEVYFDYNSATITPRAAATLTILGRALSDPRLAGGRFLIGGHTDARGSRQANLQLSERRAAAVRKFLIEQFGIDQASLVSLGFGDRQPKLPGQPTATENRRVQVVNLTGQPVR